MQTITLKLAKDLHDKGVIEKSKLVWICNKYGKVDRFSTEVQFAEPVHLDGKWNCVVDRDYDNRSYKHYRAYTLDELLVLLPEFIRDGIYSRRLIMKKQDESFYLSYESTLLDSGAQLSVNIAEAAGRMLKWLVESGYYKMGENDGQKTTEERI